MEHKGMIIFDIDGTIADRDTGDLYPDAAAWFKENKSQYLLALATNQGGVGLRYWMETEGFGEPEKFPTEEKINRRIDKVVGQIEPDGTEGVIIDVYVCFAYQSKKSGKWSPTPPEHVEHSEWSAEWRKPAPGMLLKAMEYCECVIDDILMVGDRDEDEQAAKAAGIDYMHRDEFFA